METTILCSPELAWLDAEDDLSFHSPSQAEKRMQGLKCEQIIQQMFDSTSLFSCLTLPSPSFGADLAVRNIETMQELRFEIKSAKEYIIDRLNKKRFGRFNLKTAEDFTVDYFVFVVRKTDDQLYWMEPQIEVSFIPTSQIIQFLRDRNKYPLQKPVQISCNQIKQFASVSYERILSQLR